MRVYGDVATEKTVLCPPALAPPALCSGNDLRGMGGPGRASSLRWLCCQSCSGCGEQVTAIRGLPAGQLWLQGFLVWSLWSLWACLASLGVSPPYCPQVLLHLEDGRWCGPDFSRIPRWVCWVLCLPAAFGTNDSCPNSRCSRSSWPRGLLGRERGFLSELRRGLSSGVG